MEEKSAVAEWYKGRSIFVTGGTGFMGKVLLEKILFVCSDIEALYVLMRPKRGKAQRERLESMLTIPLFERLRINNPKVLEKIIPIDGEISKEGLGISPFDKKVLIENVSVVFHLGASLRLESALPDSIEINTLGTLKLTQLCKEMTKLVALVHVSTAFCSIDIDVFEEKVYDPPDDPKEVIKTMQWMRRDALIKAAPEMIKPHNTYTYTKRLAETIIANEFNNMRVAIVRPSIVTPAGLEPFPGWVDSLNGPMGLIAAAGKGVLRVVYCPGECATHIVPVDMAISVLIVVAWKLGSAEKKPSEIPVYNLTNNEVRRHTWFEILDFAKQVGYDYPFEWQVWYPTGNLYSSYHRYFFWSILLHWIPAIFIDSLLFLLLQKRFMIRVQKRLFNGIELLRYFTSRHWYFKSQKFLSLVNDLNNVDKDLFCMDYYKMPTEEYITTCIVGTRQYCLKENPKSFPRCRFKQKILFVIDKVTKLLFFYGMFYLAWSYSDTVKHVYNFFKGVTLKLLVIRPIVPIKV